MHNWAISAQNPDLGKPTISYTLDLVDRGWKEKENKKKENKKNKRQITNYDPLGLERE